MSDSVNTTESHPFGADYSYFCAKAAELTGINLQNYKGKQMYRRLANYMKRRNIPDFATFAMRLQRDPEEVARLAEYLTINVSEFFRNREQWDVLAGQVLPLLADSAKWRMRVWSAGSAAGQEAYSAAMVFAERSLHGVFALGTDIDETSLSKARAGRYTASEVKSVPKKLLDKYFRKTDDLYVVADTIKRMVSFRRHDLLASEYPGNMDLIICRNVLIYFSERSKQDVLTRLAASLRSGGVLFMGATEAIFNPQHYGLTQIFPFFYRRMP
ncbi:MAG: CheR family methyltransferase [Bacillota bacterium]|jgi:chemotaxis protein methyltransferase CheR|nr:protein-glutamate O-methyltransferase CheR [Candidatus Fermentithermobacillaceae bacterium]